MSFTQTPRRGLKPPADQPTSSLNSLFSLYALTFTVLGCVGAFAGEIFFLNNRAVSAGHAKVVYECAAKYPLIGNPPPRIPDFDRCVQATFQFEGLFVLAAAVAVPAITAALGPVVSWVERWPLMHAASLPDFPDAAARFHALCRQARLTRRRRPSLLVVAGLRRMQAFTTALPLGRPQIVIPAKVALGADDPSRFDPVVLHEMAHVRARDATWAASIRNITWITIPVVAVACLPEIFDAGGGQFSGTVLVQALVFVAATAMIAARLLRQREIDADRQALRWLDSSEVWPDPLEVMRRFLRTGGPPVHPETDPAARWWLRPLARHPSPQARINALQDPLGGHDGFAYALVTGVVAVMVMNTAYFITWALNQVKGGWLPARMSMGAGAIVLGLALTPAFVRRARRARSANASAAWWQPVAGTASGLLLGSLIPPTATPGVTASILAGMGLRRVAMTFFLTCAGAGMAALAASLASLVADRRPRRRSAVLTAWMTVVVCCCTAAALWPIPGFIGNWIWRQWVIFILPRDQWCWLALTYPVTVALLTTWDWLGDAYGRANKDSIPIRDSPTSQAESPSRRLRVVAAPFLTPLCAGAAAATLFLARFRTGDVSSSVNVMHVAEDQWLVCTLAGWAVLVTLAVRRGISGLASAGVSAWLTTAVAGAVFITYQFLTADRHSIAAPSSWLTTPSVWLFYLALPTACLALLRVHPRSTVKKSTVKKPWITPIGATAGALGLAALVLVIGPGGKDTALPQPRSRETAGQILTQAQAEQVASAVGAALGPTWVSDHTPVDNAAIQHTIIVPATCKPLALEEYLNILPKPLARAESRYQMAESAITRTENMSIRVESFANPVPSAFLTEANQAIRDCQGWTAIEPAGSVSVTAHGAAAPRLGGPAWRADFSMDTNPGSASVTWVMITAGHNFILISQTIDSISPSQPDEEAITVASTTVIDTLNRTPRTPVKRN